MTLFRLSRIVAFWSALAFSYVSALLPGAAAPTLGSSDKLDHMSAFLTLTILARLAYPRRSAWMIALGLSVFGAFIEISQAMPIFHRDANIFDWVADNGAILLGLPIAYLLARFVPRLFAD